MKTPQIKIVNEKPGFFPPAEETTPETGFLRQPSPFTEILNEKPGFFLPVEPQKQPQKPGFCDNLRLSPKS
jgi:hypothetical protein